MLFGGVRIAMFFVSVIRQFADVVALARAPEDQ